ncbi:NAD(P)-binding protein [Wolfiporia cocos MD-104 SS10]|uniref:NAD(P)-binding protein n=1 Tax=Wolfiporia cocos (strain MD-104) TaxID=742152 RepID=A0A2H3JNI2_WOLCO|nr:NAD(P)-binding protein [Wolfiporia cocos MD-104 SS10]
MTPTAGSRVWFITGTSQGLGRALLEEILKSNERAVATLRKPEALASLADKYPPSQLLILPLDVTKQEQIVEAFAATERHFGRLDVVVNNAGYGLEGEIEATSEEDARKQFEVLFWGPVHIMKEAIRLFRDVNPPGHGGRILNISSCGGYAANPTLAYYNAGKFALEGLTEAFTKEMLPEWNIKGIIIQPGGFRTEWYRSSLVKVPVHPKYDTPTSPSNVHRKMCEQPFIGDAAKAAKALMQVASMPEPPLRVQLGTESLLIVRAKARQTIRDGEKYEALSHSTNCDEVDRNSIIESFGRLWKDD